LLTNYYTLRALVWEWNPRLAGARILDGYSQHRGSLILVFEDVQGGQWSLNTSVQAPNMHIFMYAGANRSRKNVVDVFPELRNETVERLRIANRDRQITLQLTNGSCLHFFVYGPKANVYLDHEGITSFRGDFTTLPALRSVVDVPSAEAVESVLASGKMLRSVLPLFPKKLIEEVWYRAGGIQDPTTITSVIGEMEDDLQNPSPRIYWDEERKPLLSMIRLGHIAAEGEKMSSTDEAVRVVARRRLALHRFSGTYDPLIRLLKKRVVQSENGLSRVEEELSKPGRADKHEHFGHLLMAQAHTLKAGSDEVRVADILGDGAEVTIVLDPRLNAIENAQAYYGKAKRSREARKKSMERIQGLKRTAQNTQSLYEQALNLQTVEEVKTFQMKNEGHLKALMAAPEDPDAIPYRRFVLDAGYEVWVGRNAKQNDQLTMHDARKYDLWLHARGVAGSHTVLRLRGRTDSPPKQIIEQAASIAAWYSKARTSGLAPVIVVERKYVRKPRKALPGTVVVEREKVILVEPGLPE